MITSGLCLRHGRATLHLDLSGNLLTDTFLPALGGANAGGGVLLLSDLDGTLYSHAPGAEGARSLARFKRSKDQA